MFPPDLVVLQDWLPHVCNLGLCVRVWPRGWFAFCGWLRIVLVERPFVDRHAFSWCARRREGRGGEGDGEGEKEGEGEGKGDGEGEGEGEGEGGKEGEGEGEGRAPAGHCSSYHTRAREGL